MTKSVKKNKKGQGNERGGARASWDRVAWEAVRGKARFAGFGAELVAKPVAGSSLPPAGPPGICRVCSSKLTSIIFWFGVVRDLPSPGK